MNIQDNIHTFKHTVLFYWLTTECLMQSQSYLQCQFRWQHFHSDLKNFFVFGYFSGIKSVSFSSRWVMAAFISRWNAAHSAGLSATSSASWLWDVVGWAPARCAARFSASEMAAELALEASSRWLSRFITFNPAWTTGRNLKLYLQMKSAI